MSLYIHKNGPDINRGAQEYLKTPGALLLDVRGDDEYRAGHLPGSKNLPLPMLSTLYGGLGKKDTPIYVYCLTGNRSARAAGFLKRRGYTRVKNIGGISDYTGAIER